MKKQSFSGPPVVHILTSTAVQNLCANGILASGGRPLLTGHIRELRYITSQALLLNMGMWHPDSPALFSAACSQALRRGIPVVLDPVGAGFSPVRRRFALKLIQKHPKKIFLKANSSEMIALAEDRVLCRGVDSTDDTENALSAAEFLEHVLSGWMISGAIDHTGSEGQKNSIQGGHSLMGKICGTGCLLGALTALALSETDDITEAATCASGTCKKAGEYASRFSDGPGTFQSHLIDGLFKMRRGEL